MTENSTHAIESNRKQILIVIPILLAVFALILILQIIWRELVLGLHGFREYVFSVSVESLFGSFLISAAIIFLEMYFDVFICGLINIFLWGVLCSSSCIYAVNPGMNNSTILEYILFPIFVVVMPAIWILLWKNNGEIKTELWFGITGGSLCGTLLFFFLCKNNICQTLFINLLITVILYVSLLYGKSKRLFMYIGIVICAFLYTVSASYQLGQYGKSMIMHEGKEYKVLFQDSDFLYCEGSDGSILIPNTGMVD